MSFGVGVGDIIAVSELAGKIRKRFVDSPEEYRAISEEYEIKVKNAFEFLSIYSTESRFSPTFFEISKMHSQSGTSQRGRRPIYMISFQDAERCLTNWKDSLTDTASWT